MLQQSSTQPTHHPLTTLPREDLNLITEFVLNSGSLKALAKSYSVSYPTIRQRLDQTIQRLRHAVQGQPPDPLRDHLAHLIARGQLTPSDVQRIEQLARQQTATNLNGTQP